jgi:hypothetical protein
MPSGYLRIPPNGPYVGKPPVLATPQLASLILTAVGAAAKTEFIGPSVLGQYRVDGGAPTYELPVALRPGYRYEVVASFSVDQSSSTHSHLFTPSWNKKLTSTHAYEGVGAFGLGTMSGPNNHVNAATMSEITTVAFRAPLFTPVVDYEALQFSLNCADWAIGGLYFRYYEAWVQVWELGGILP